MKKISICSAIVFSLISSQAQHLSAQEYVEKEDYRLHAESALLKLCNSNFVSLFGGSVDECPNSLKAILPACHKDLDALIPEKIERDMKVFEKYTRMYSSCLTVRYSELYPEKKNAAFIENLKKTYTK